MNQTRLIMGMPITIELSEMSGKDTAVVFNEAFDYFTYVDQKFSTYKEASEISRYNNKQLADKDLSADMQAVLELCAQTKRETNGYFDITHHGKVDPSGLVKGWSVYNAYKKLRAMGYTVFYIDAGGDIQVSGKVWTVGIKNPFKETELIKVLKLRDEGVATSGTYIRGQHVYNPLAAAKQLTEVVSVTVIGPNVYDADRFATAAFAMQKEGIRFIDSLNGFEGYMIDRNGIAAYTSGFEKYVA
jgi:thiamine biosynthesis lipoprotein